MGLFHHVLVYMGDLHLVHPALNWSILNVGISIMVQQVSLMMFSLTMVDYPMSFLLLSSWVVAYSILVSAQGPLDLGLGLKGLGPWLDNYIFVSFNLLLFDSRILF